MIKALQYNVPYFIEIDSECPNSIVFALDLDAIIYLQWNSSLKIMFVKTMINHNLTCLHYIHLNQFWKGILE